MPVSLRLISSMATKALLADLAQAWSAVAPEVTLVIESVGGVDAARRVQAGEAFDAVVLASDAIDKLGAAGHVQPGTRVDLVRSGVWVAVRGGHGAARHRQRRRRARRGAGRAQHRLFHRPQRRLPAAALRTLGHRRRGGSRTSCRPARQPGGRAGGPGRGGPGLPAAQRADEPARHPACWARCRRPSRSSPPSRRRGRHQHAADAVRALLAWCASPATAALKQRHGMESA
jgi:hypothetical protein